MYNASIKMDILDKIKSKEIKGYLTLRNRIIFEGAIYHITQRAPGKELVFIEDNDYLKFLSVLKTTVKKFELDLFCFSLLPNHLHLLLKIHKKNLPKTMQYLFQRYAFYYNKKYKRKGHVFCGSYRASLCNDDSYLLTASLYIHLNPYKAGLCSNLDDYKWSSLFLYTNGSKKTFVDFREILLILDSNIIKARKKYSEMLKSSSNIEGGNLIDPSSVSAFIERVKKITKRFYKKSSDLDKLIDEFSSKKRIVNPKEKKARKYLIQQLLANGYSIREITELLSITRKTLYNILNSD